MKKRLVLLGAVALAAVAAYAAGLHERLDADGMRALLLDLGAWAPVIYVALFALLEPLGVPGIAFVIPASIVWPLWLAFFLSWLGAIAAGVVGFSFARYLARDWVAAHLPERFHRYDERLAERGLTTVILVRLLFFLAPPAHWALGLSRVRFGPFLAGTAIGFVPGIALWTVAGRSLLDWVSAQGAIAWLAVAAAVLIFVALRRYRRRRASYRRVQHTRA